MNKADLELLPLLADSDERSLLEKYVELKVVAPKDGESANGAQFLATFPAHGTQPARLLAGLLCGKEFTHKSAWFKLGISRLAAVVHALKRDYGWGVINPGLQVVNRFGEKTSVGLYRLRPEVIAWAGCRGERYADIELARMASLTAMVKQRMGSY